MVIINCNIFNKKGDAIVIVGNKIEKIGKIDEFINRKDIIDAKGKKVIPGFIDCHVHIDETGLEMNQIDLSEATSIEEINEIIRKNKKEITIAKKLKPHKIKENRYPNEKEIEFDFPVIIFREDLHSAVCNKKASKLLGVKPGLLFGKEYNKAVKEMKKFIQDEEYIEGYIKVDEMAIKEGVTTICGLFSDFKEYNLYLNVKDKMKVSVIPFIQTTNVEKVKEYGLKTIGGCILADGSISSGTAAFFEHYEDNNSNFGILYFTDKEIERFVKNAKDLQIAIHAIGDRAVNQVVRAYSKIDGKRNRIEHAELIQDEDIKLIKKNNIIISTQPAFVTHFHKIYEKRLGKRAKKMNNFRLLLDEGIHLCFGSDSPVTKINPIEGIKAAINHYIEKNRITIDEAIKCFTEEAAFANFSENEIGKIEKNYIADIVILNDDLSIYCVIKDGKICYSKDS